MPKKVIICVNPEIVLADYQHWPEIAWIPLDAVRVADHAAAEIGIQTSHNNDFAAWSGGRIQQHCRRCGLVATSDDSVSDEDLVLLNEVYRGAIRDLAEEDEGAVDQEEFVVGFLRPDGSYWFLPVAAGSIELAAEGARKLAAKSEDTLVGVWVSYEGVEFSPDHIVIQLGQEQEGVDE